MPISIFIDKILIDSNSAIAADDHPRNKTPGNKNIAIIHPRNKTPGNKNIAIIHPRNNY